MMKRETQMAKMGRPSTYTPELAKEICKRLLTRNLSKVCEDEDMPSRETIYTWMTEFRDFSDNYARACKIRREDRFERMEDVVEHEPDVQRARLKVDVIKWQLSKEEPKKYSDKLDVTSDGDKLDGLIIIKNSNDDISKETK